MSNLPKKKFEVPVELHRVLGNQFAVDQHLKKEKRKKAKSQAREEEKRRQSVPTLNEYFNSAAMHKQVQLELEIERLRSAIHGSTIPLDQTVDHSNVPETPSRGSTSTPSNNYQQVQYYNNEVLYSQTNQPVETTTQMYSPAPPVKPSSGNTSAPVRNNSKNTKSKHLAAETIAEETHSRSHSFDGQHVANYALEGQPQGAKPPSSDPAITPQPEAGANSVSHPASQQSDRGGSAVSYITDTPGMLSHTYSSQPTYGGIPFPTPRNTISDHLGQQQQQHNFPDIAQVGFGLAMPGNSPQYLQHQYGNGAANLMHISQMYSPLTGMNGGSQVFPQSYQAPQVYHAGSQGAQLQSQYHHSNQQQHNYNTSRSTNQNNSKMFVLSSAPKLSYEQLVAQDLQHFRQQQQARQLSGQSQYSNVPQSGGISSGSHLENSPTYEDRHFQHSQFGAQGLNGQSTMQDQIYRFAEIRSLFEMPNSAEDDVYARPQVSARGHNASLLEEAANSKLNDSIDRHKQRLNRGRQPKPKANASLTSPRGRIHKVRNPALQAQNQTHAPQNNYYPSQPSGSNPHGSLHGGPSIHSQQPHSPPESARSAGNTRPAPGRMDSMDGISLFGSTFSDVTESAPHPPAPRELHASSPKSASRSVGHAGSVGHLGIAQPASHTASFITASELSALLDMPQLNPDPSVTEFGQVVQGSVSTGVHGANGTVSAEKQKVVVEMSMEQFEQATKRINDQLRSTVSAVVHEELMKDAQAQHYTQRLQKASLAKSTQPLSKKIEDKVEEKLADLKREIEALRAVKLAALPKPATDDDEDEEGSEAENEVAANKDSWFLKNELGGRKASKGHSPKAGGKHSKHSPAPLSKLEAELDLDFTAISQDIKKSVEYVMKKHMHAYPSPQRTGGSPAKDHADSKPRSVSKDEAEGFHPTATAPTTTATTTTTSTATTTTVPPAQATKESPRKEDATSAVAAVEPSGSVEKAGKAKGKKNKHKHAASTESASAAVAPPPAAPAPVAPAASTASEAGSTGKKGVLSSISSLFRSNSSSSTTSNSSGQTKARGAANTAPSSTPHTVANAAHHGHRHAPAHSSLGAIADAEEGEEGEDDGENSVSRMLREREQWEADINQAELDFDATSANLNALTDAKGKLKKELKEWQRAFEVRVGRPATDADKSAIEDRFQAYQKVTKDAKEAARRQKDAEIALRALRERENDL